MSKQNNQTDEYVRIIMEDDLGKIAGEKTVVYRETERIERLYTFADGAVVRYEWQSFPFDNSEEKYNHRFSLVTLPEPNPHKLKSGIIKTIDYPEGGR